jgi:hypothetical protein
MKSVDPKIDRLLRSAARAHEDVPAALPFGFDTRIVALWRSSMKKPNGLTPLLRRIALLSTVVIVVSTIAAAREAGQNRKLGESFANEYAIADSAIQDEFSQ